MNRDLKFRAWHCAEKKLCQVDVLTNNGAFLIGVNNGPDELTDGGKMIIISPKNGRFCMNEDIELMQFTGLKDKNGKEIYEGDIITRIINDKVKYNIIDFKPGGYVLSKINTRRFTTMYNSESYWYEVIGNIYETPALLDQ